MQKEVRLFKNEKSPLYWANLTAKEKIIINQGGTSSGKTEAIIRVLFTIAIIRKGYVITVISNTITKLKEDALRIAKNVAKIPEVKEFIKDYNSTDRVFTFHNDSLIEFKSFEDEEQAKGGKRHILYVSEATRIPYMIFYQADLRTKVRTFIDYNPTSTFWAHNKVINCPVDDKGRKEFNSVKVIRSWHIHNPYLTDEEHDRLERIADKQLKKVYARGLTGMLSGTIYPGWVEVDNFPWSDGVIWYVDWGFSEKESADPVAAGRIAFKPKNSDLDFIADEIIYKQGVPASIIAKTMWASGYKTGQPCYCDHSPDDIRELRLAGIAAFPASKGPGSLTSGILFMRSKKVGYTKRSENIREERKNYKFLEIEGIVTNTPIDEWNHHMDGIRYGCRTHSLVTGT
jgi:phage terminase large subunit